MADLAIETDHDHEVMSTAGPENPPDLERPKDDEYLNALIVWLLSCTCTCLCFRVRAICFSQQRLDQLIHVIENWLREKQDSGHSRLSDMRRSEDSVLTRFITCL